NVPVKQDGKQNPWRAKPSEEKPKRYFFFQVLPADSPGGYEYPGTMIVDYSKWDEYFFLNPVQNTVDYLVYPDPDNKDLILGKSYYKTFIGEFYLGYFVLERDNRSNYPRVSHFLSKREWQTVKKFSEVFIEGPQESISPEKITQNIDAQLDRIKSKRKRSLKLLLFTIEYLLPLLSFKGPFSKMSASARKALLQKRLAKTRRGSLLRDLSRIKILFLMGYYGDSAVAPAVHYLPVEKRSRYDPQKYKIPANGRLKIPPLNVNTLNADVCVIGSGAGGAVAAYNAAAAGNRVVLLEEGSYVDSADMTHNEGEMIAKLYKEGGLQTTVDLEMSLLQGQCLGGSTVINNAICFRLDEAGFGAKGTSPVLERWEKMKAHIDPAKLDAAYQRVEQVIQPREIMPEIAGKNGYVLLDGFKKLQQQNSRYQDFPAGLFRKNKKECTGCGHCNYGCPYGQKLSMLQTYIPMAVEKGAQVVTHCHAVKVLKKNGRVTGVKSELRNGSELVVHADKVVVSCGAIGSSVLLMKSGIGGRNVGKRFSFNAGTPMTGLFPGREIDAYDGVQMASYVDAGDFILETIFNPPMSFSGYLPGWFGSHFRRMAAYNRLACIGVVVGTEANARVKRSKFFRDLLGPVVYRLEENDLDKMKAGMALAAEVLFAEGAEKVFPASLVDMELDASQLTSPEKIRHFIDEHIREPKDIILNSSHPQGGNIMSDDKRIGVIDSRFKVHGTENLFVCDASIFPTTIGINPQLTIMAMSEYFSDLQGWVH
ncbi:MAG: GMC family oxidoreductase, partial [Calditrichia bacterium]